MKRFQAIAAMSLNRVIGSGNRIPWHLPEDFRWFKQQTMGGTLVMGRRTFESIGRPLPGRTTVVLSRSGFRPPEPASTPGGTRGNAAPAPGISAPPGVGSGGEERATPVIVLSAFGLLSTARLPEPVFICGGAEVYAQALPCCSDLFLTLVKREVAGDAWFPVFEDRFVLESELRDTPEFRILHYRNRQPEAPGG
jgi:dihydrofolate reductase